MITSIATPSDATFYPIRVLSLQVEIGRDNAADAPLALLESAAGKQILVSSPQAGRVVATALAPGDVIRARAVLVRIDPEPAAASDQAPAPTSQPPRARPLEPALLRQHARRSTALGFGPIAEEIRVGLRAEGLSTEIIAASEDRIAEAAAEQAGRARATAKAASEPAHPAAPGPEGSVSKTHPAAPQANRAVEKTATPPKPKTATIRPTAPKRSMNVDAWSLPAAIVAGLGVAWSMDVLPDDPGRVIDELRTSLAGRLGWSHAPAIVTDAALEIPDVAALDEAPQPAFDADRQAAFERLLEGSP